MENSETQTLKIKDIVKQTVTADVKFVIGIIIFLAGVVAPYYGIRQDIALMKSDVSNINSNHEVHMQDALKNIEEIKMEDKDQDKEIIELQKQILVIMKK